MIQKSAKRCLNLSFLPLYSTQASREFVAFSSVMRHASATYPVPRTVLRTRAIYVIMRAGHIMIHLCRLCLFCSSTASRLYRNRFLTVAFLAHDRFQTLAQPSQWLLGGKQFRCLPRCCPTAESHSNRRLHTIAEGYYHVQIVMVNLPLHLSLALLTN